jgi:hypothetical protein
MPDSDIARQQRAARNQSIFREVNEQVVKLGNGNGTRADELQQFVCECADLECIEPIDVAPQEYEDVRGQGTTFIVAPGHAYPDVERVILESGRFTVVEKIGAAAELSRSNDPRRRPAVSRAGREVSPVDGGR